MCTVSIHRTGTSLMVTMNRDEMRTRGPEIPPERGNGVDALLAPRDSDRGGMWIAVNTSGVVACLLNAYFPGDADKQTGNDPLPSRGDIIPPLLRLGALDEVRAAFCHRFDPSPYPSFTLLLCSFEGSIAQTWTGADLQPPQTFDEEWTLLMSSSWMMEAVATWRRGAFAQWRDAGCPMRSHLPTFHVLHPEGEESVAPLMDREYATTRSITQVEVTRDAEYAIMRYWPRSILPDGPPTVQTLPVRRRPAVASRG